MYHSIYRCRVAACLLVILLLFPGRLTAGGNDLDAYEARKAALIESSLENVNRDILPIQAFLGLPLDEAELTDLLTGLDEEQDVDFNLIKLVRILYLSDGAYDDQILPAIEGIPLWFTPGENLRVYWSENHMIMYLGTAYLLHQRYGWDVYENTEDLLREWLQLKINYGFYEFFSSTYFPYTLSGLLNVLDFAEDEDIRIMADQVINKLLEHILLVTNDRGAYFPAAGRNYPEKYNHPYGHNHFRPIWLLTGMGEMPTSPAVSGSFLVTSTFDAAQALTAWNSEEDRTLHLGHSLSSGFDILGHLAREDRIVFQWSSGGYLHPEMADETMWFLTYFDMWGHNQFLGGLPDLSFLPIELGPVIATIAGAFSRSSYLGGVDYKVFKNDGVTLSSVQDYWAGRKGYQQYPCVAGIGETGIYLGSGEPIDWDQKSRLGANSHLPSVTQDENVALLVYRPKIDLFLLGVDLHVSLKWSDEDFDEVRHRGKWVLGRDGNDYIAVLKQCNGTVNGFQSCNTWFLPQIWAFVVGNSDMYGTFDDFENIVSNARHSGRWTFNEASGFYDYEASLALDGREIQQVLTGDQFDLEPPADALLAAEEHVLPVFPNPASRSVQLDLGQVPEQAGNLRLKVTDLMGRSMIDSPLENSGTAPQIDVSGWPAGMYSIVVEGGDSRYSQKLMVTGQ